MWKRKGFLPWFSTGKFRQEIRIFPYGTRVCGVVHSFNSIYYSYYDGMFIYISLLVRKVAICF